MRNTLHLAVFICLSVNALSQERSVHDLYKRTNEVSTLINSAKYIETLDKADELIMKYHNFPGSEDYLTYLYMYKAGAYLGLGDMMLSRHCDSLALHFANESSDAQAGFIIRNNIAVLDIERQDYQSCFGHCNHLLHDSEISPSRDERAMVLNNMALCALKLNDYIAADTLFQIVLSIAESDESFSHFDPNLSYRNYGLYLKRMDRKREALDFFSKAVFGYSKAFGGNHYQTGQSCLDLGGCFESLGEVDSAKVYLDRAIMILNPKDSSYKTSQNEIMVIKALKARASFFHIVGKQKNALLDIELAIERIDRIMKSYAATESGFIIAQLFRPIFNLAVEIALSIFDDSDDIRLFYKALKYSDQAKRMSLQALYQISWQIDLSPEIEKVYRDYYSTRQKLSGLDFPSTALVELVEEHGANRRRLDSVLGFSAIQSRIGDEYSNPEIDMDKIDLLSYHDFGSYFGLFIKFRKDCSYVRIAKTQELLKSITDIKIELAKPRIGNYTRSEFDEFLQHSTRLFDELLMPAWKIQGKVINIQTDGELNGLPFGILINRCNIHEMGDEQDFKSLPFFIRDYSISYVSTFRSNHGAGFSGKGILSFITSTNNEHFSGVEMEFELIRKSFDGDILKEFQSRADILHYAGNSRVDINDPANSFMWEYLNWPSILRMDNRGKEVYLNSCQTGLGKYVEGESMLSHGLAFLLSGADQVLETYWEVPDRQSAEIAGFFYKAKGFKNSAQSLRSAKLTYLECSQPGFDHPFYWAGTVVQGGITISATRLRHFHLFIVLILPILLIVSLISRRKFTHR